MRVGGVYGVVKELRIRREPMQAGEWEGEASSPDITNSSGSGPGTPHVVDQPWHMVCFGPGCQVRCLEQVISPMSRSFRSKNSIPWYGFLGTWSACLRLLSNYRSTRDDVGEAFIVHMRLTRPVSGRISVVTVASTHSQLLYFFRGPRRMAACDGQERCGLRYAYCCTSAGNPHELLVTRRNCRAPSSRLQSHTVLPRSLQSTGDELWSPGQCTGCRIPIYCTGRSTSSLDQCGCGYLKWHRRYC